MNLDSIRRAVRARGLTPATLVPEASGGRIEESCIRPARVTEGDSLRVISIGVGEAWPGSLAYLDGIQRSEIIAYDGSAPILVAEIAAAVRERQDRCSPFHCRTMSRCIRCVTWSTPAMPWIRRGARSRSSSVTATGPPPRAGWCWTALWR